MTSLSAGELFHVRAAATGNVRSPTVDSRADVDDDRRRRRRGILQWRRAEGRL